MLILRQLNTYVTSSRKVGFVDTLTLYNVYMTREVILIGQNFQWLLEIFCIKDVCSTCKNQQSNAICQRMHQTVNDVLRILVHTNPP
jgi:hypothetical protein